MKSAHCHQQVEDDGMNWILRAETVERGKRSSLSSQSGNVINGL